MKKSIVLVLASVWTIFSLSAKVNTGIYLVLANGFDFDNQVSYVTTNLKPEFEFTIDLGEGFYGLSLPATEIGYNETTKASVKKLFRAYDSKKDKLSPFSSKYIHAENGMRLYYIPNTRYEKELFFVVNSKTLEVNYNATFGVGGTFDAWGSVIKKPIYHACSNDGLYVEELNTQEGIYTYTIMSKTGLSQAAGVQRDCFWGALHDGNDLYHFFPAQTNNAHITVFNKQFGVKKNSAEFIPIRFAMNLNRLRVAIFSEKNTFMLDEDPTTKFSLQGDKMVLYKEFAAGVHNVTVTTPDFEMYSCNPFIFNMDRAGLVKLWFYADNNPNMYGNMHIEKNVLPLTDQMPNVGFVPTHKAKYVIETAQTKSDGKNFLSNLNGKISLESIADLNNLSAKSNKNAHILFLTKYFEPGLGIAKHALDMMSILFAENWSESNGTSKVWGYTDNQGSIVETAFSYSNNSYENFNNKLYRIKQASYEGGVRYYTILNEAGYALTNTGAKEPLFMPLSAGNKSQQWIITPTENNNPDSVTDFQETSFTAHAIGNKLYIEGLSGDENITILTSAGLPVLVDKAATSSYSCTLTQGIYVIKINDVVLKTIVQ